MIGFCMHEHKQINKIFFCLGIIALLVLPALNNVHYDPQPQFWAEITVAWAIIGLFVLLLLSSSQISIPSISIPLVIFAIYLVIQPHLLIIDYPGLNYISALELFLCTLLALVINTYCLQYSLKKLVIQIGYALVIGAILQSLIGFIQYTGTTHYFGDMIFYDSSHPTSNIFGHFGQRNHYAHYLSWGCFSLIYLAQQQKIKAKFFYPLLFWLIFSLTLSASRSVFIYFGLACLISLVYQFKSRSANSWKFCQLIILATILLFSVEYLYPIIHKLFTSHNNFSSGLGRLDNDSGTGRRGVEWAKAWLVFSQHPLWGTGWNGYAKQSVLLQYLYPHAAANSGLFTNCHNLILQILAETGLVGGIVVILGIAGVIWRLIVTQRRFSDEVVLILCLLGTTLSHSMNEYPLWYMYFLGGFICFLSCDKPLYIINLRSIYAIIGVVCVAGFAYLIINASIIFDTLVDYYDTPDDQDSFTQQAKYLENLQQNRIWEYYAAYTLDNYINVDTDFTNKLMPVQQQYNYTHRFDSFHPYPDTLIKEAMLAWKLGKYDQAQQLVKLEVLAFPVYNASSRITLKAKQYKTLQDLIPTK
jgi:O-antigen ligase